MDTFIKQFNTDNKKGFTLVELLVAMAVTVIVAGAAVSSYMNQQENQLSQKQIVEMQQNMRAALYVMTMELRMAGYDPYDKYGAGIVTAGNGVPVADGGTGPLTFTLVADDDCIDNDNDNPDPDSCSDNNVDEEGELKTISFELYDAYNDGDNDIGRAVGAGAPQAIAENIQTLAITYLDGNGATLAPPVDTTQVTAVQISITAMPDTAKADHTGNKSRSISSVVNLRNL